MKELDGQLVVMKLIADGVQRLAPPVAPPREVAEVIPPSGAS